MSAKRKQTISQFESLYLTIPSDLAILPSDLSIFPSDSEAHGNRKEGILGTLLAAINLGFGLALADLPNFGPAYQCHTDMACPKSDPQSLPNIVTSLIGPIWRK
jgi:hypothetical protein